MGYRNIHPAVFGTSGLLCADFTNTSFLINEIFQLHFWFVGSTHTTTGNMIGLVEESLGVWWGYFFWNIGIIFHTGTQDVWSMEDRGFGCCHRSANFGGDYLHGGWVYCPLSMSSIQCLTLDNEKISLPSMGSNYRNSLRPSDACSVKLPLLVHIMACRLVGTKSSWSLSESVLEYCWFDP